MAFIDLQNFNVLFHVSFGLWYRSIETSVYHYALIHSFVKLKKKIWCYVILHGLYKQHGLCLYVWPLLEFLRSRLQSTFTNYFSICLCLFESILLISYFTFNYKFDDGLFWPFLTFVSHFGLFIIYRPSTFTFLCLLNLFGSKIMIFYVTFN